jgi:tetratricopeptide (TPR) repeat protein
MTAKIFSPQRHKAHKEKNDQSNFLCVLCALFTRLSTFSLTIYCQAILACLILCSCAGSRTAKTVTARKSKPLEVPAGVDTSVALASQTLARQLFVEYPQQVKAKQLADSAVIKFERSDRLWQILEGKADSLAAIDTVASIEKFNSAGRSLRRAIELEKKAAMAPNDVISRELSLQAIESARADFEQALQLNPFDQNTRLWLAKTYQLLAKRFLDEKNYVKAIGVLEHLLRLEKDQHALYARLGDCYFALKKYPAALTSFQKAAEVLAATTIFNVPPERELTPSNMAAATDSAAMFLYLYYQGEAHIKMLEAQPALAVLRRAVGFAPTPENRAAAEANVNWINWDDGNIPASERRDSLLTLVDAAKYVGAAKGFEKLLPKLRSVRARRETGWRLATLEYNHLQKEDQALRTMQTVVHAIGGDSASIKADTLYQKYLDSYGAMCFNQGQKMLAAKKFTTALTYFQQSANLAWSYRAKSYLELGKLAVNDPPRAEHLAKEALKLSNQLDAREELAALELVTQALKRQGKFTEARQYFEKYRELVQGSNSRVQR